MLPPDDPVLHVGDRLRIVCPEAPELCIDRAVGADGTIDLPHWGAIPAAIRHLSEVAKQISDRLPGTLYPPLVEIRLLGPATGVIAIEGFVDHPLRLFAPHGITADRLWTAAKLLPEADRAILGPSRLLGPGRTITVPAVTADRRISVVGAVTDPKALPPANDLTLAMALEATGGLGPHGDPNAIVVTRFGEPIPVQIPVDNAFHLLPGDIVRVGLVVNRRYVLVRGLVNRPGSVEYAPGMTATRVLALAGGFSEKAKRGTLVWQTGPKTFRLSMEFLLSGRIPDPIVSAEDTLTVEAARP